MSGRVFDIKKHSNFKRSLEGWVVYTAMLDCMLGIVGVVWVCWVFCFCVVEKAQLFRAGNLLLALFNVFHIEKTGK